MRLNIRVVALCAALLAHHAAVAAELPQRWVSAGGAIGFYPIESAKAP
jgi:iron complex transport system substrate-binding protein